MKNSCVREEVIFFSYMILFKEGGVGGFRCTCMTWNTALVVRVCARERERERLYLMICNFTFLHHLFHLCTSELQLVFSD